MNPQELRENKIQNRACRKKVKKSNSRCVGVSVCRFDGLTVSPFYRIPHTVSSFHRFTAYLLPFDRIPGDRKSIIVAKSMSLKVKKSENPRLIDLSTC